MANQGESLPETSALNTGTTTPASAQEIAGIALSMRIPPFWRDKPRLWFVTFEAATTSLHKNQSQLSQMVIARLEKEDIEQIADLLYNPPEKNEYEALKDRLISAYEESDSRQFQQLLSEMELGDQKPSQLLRRMRNLARNKVPDSTLQLMWTNLLPSNIRSVLAVNETFQTKTTLDEQAALADKIIEQNVNNVNSITSSHRVNNNPSSASSNFEVLLIEEVRKLSLEVAELKKHQNDNYYRRGRHHSRFRSTSRFRQRSTSRPSPTSPYCYYHSKFGNEARKCTPPCTYKNKQEN